jgi:Mn2+/Fe2+ NRAMP family transporter
MEAQQDATTHETDQAVEAHEADEAGQEKDIQSRAAQDAKAQDAKAQDAEARQGPSGAKSEGMGRRAHLLMRFLRLLGPGLIPGAADDDPTGIGTYAQAGASLGYGLFWTTLLTLLMMMTVQYMAAKIAIVHRQRLAAVIRNRFPRPVLYAAVLGLIIANTVNAGADIGAIAAAVNLVVPLPTWLLYLPVALLMLALMMLVARVRATMRGLPIGKKLASAGWVVTAVVASPACSSSIRRSARCCPTDWAGADWAGAQP